MKFSVDKAVFEKFPNLIIALPIIMGFDNTKAKSEALNFLRKTEKEVRKKTTLDLFWKDPRVTAYLQCFKGFGVDPGKFVPAHVALSVRMLEGKNLPDINPMVNLYNAMSIKYLTPFVLEHRMILQAQSHLRGNTVPDILGQVLGSVPVPVEEEATTERGPRG